MLKLDEQTLGMDRYLVQNKQDMDEMVAQLMTVDEFAFDTETNGIHHHAQLVGMSFSDGKSGWYIPLAHTTGEQVPLFYAIEAIRPLMESEKVKIAHNLKFDYKILKWAGLEVNIKGCLDTMIAHWLLDENERHGLKLLVKKYLKYEMTEFKDVTKGKMQFWDVDPVEGAKYASDDAICTFRLMELFAPMLAGEELMDVFLRVEMPFVKVLGDMEDEGVRINAEFLKEQGEWVGEELARLEKGIYEDAGHEFNINSGKQLGTVLFEEMDIPVMSRSAKTNAPSTDAEVLGSLAKKGYPIAQKLTRYRKLKKVKGTYIEGLLERLGADGKIHGSFHQHGTVTGRLSSSDPNLQNIPIKFKEVPIRKAFEAPDGYVWVNADYSQIELRVMAHFSQDPAMMEAYFEGKDLHCKTASDLSGIEYPRFIEAVDRKDADEELDEMDKKCITLRSLAKGVNFGIIYGRGPHSLAESENISVSDAKDFIARYFNLYQGVQKFITLTHNTAKRNGEIRLLTWRKRRLPLVNSSDKGIAAGALRQAVNSKIQGSAGDLIKLAMNKLHYEVLPPFGAKLIIQVHDELLILAPESRAEEVKKAVKDTMVNIVELRVPLDADVRLCKNWFDGH